MDKNINTIGFWLIDKVMSYGATQMTFTLHNVTKHNKKVGDWEIIVRQKPKQKKNG